MPGTSEPYVVACTIANSRGETVTFVLNEKQKCIDKHNAVMLWDVPVVTSESVGSVYMDDERLRQFKQSEVVRMAMEWFDVQ